MKLFGNREPQTTEDAEKLAESAVQSAAEDGREAAEKAEAIAKSGLVLSIEGLSEETAPVQTAPLSINTEPYPEKKAADDDDDFLRELHALLDEKEKLDFSESEEAPAPAPAEAPAVPVFAEEPFAAAEPAPEPEIPEEPVEAPDAEEIALNAAPAAVAEAAAPEAEPAAEEIAPEAEPAAEEIAPEAAAEAVAEPAPEPAPFKVEDPAPEPGVSRDTKPFASVSYESMAKAMEESGQSRGPSQTRRTRSAIDDETLLAEIYTLMGDTPKASRGPQAASAEISGSETPELRNVSGPIPENQTPLAGAVPMQEPVIPEPQTVPEQQLRQNPYGYERREPVRTEPAQYPTRDAGGAPGWLKGLFLLILSAALSGMTLYAVMMDVFGKVF